MAEVLINSAESNTHADGLPDPEAPSSDRSLFHRRIEFHNARKQFTGFSNGGGDFKLETLNHSPKPQIFNSGSSALGGKKPDGSEILENGLDSELNFRITFRRIGAGLENLGYTCFLNSVLQCLTYTEPLAAYLLSGRHQISCRTAGFCALCAIQKHVSRALQSTGRILAPKELVANLRCISRSFRNSRQEDAHEYMVNLLESMHKCCLPSGVPIDSPSAYNKSLVHKIFCGRLRSQVKCMQCSFCSNKFDPFLDLSLEISKAESLYKALGHFTAKEQLDGGERHYQCQQCKQKVKALKQLTIHSAPDVLAIHLKRFDSHVPGQKIDKKILFGSTLDLKPFVTGPYDGDLRYTLYAVLVHAGWSTHSGHYYCFVSPSRGMWYCLDDHQIAQVNERKVLEQKAYMLFYSRDNRNFASKKPMDVQKENMAINAIGRNIVYSNFNEGLKETIHNGPIEKRLNDPNSSAAISQRDASKETIKKEASIQKMNGLVMAECSSLNKDHLLERSSKLLPQSVSSVKASNGSLKLDNAVTTTTDAKIITCSENITMKDPSDSVATSLNCNQESTRKDLSDSIDKPPKKDRNDSIDIPPKKDLTDSNKPPKKDPSDSIGKPHKKDPSDFIDKPPKKDLSDSIDIPPNCSIRHRSPGDLCVTENSSGQNGDKASAPDFSGKTLEKNDPIISLCQTSRDDCQTGGFSLASAGGDSFGEQSGDHVQRTADFALTELSSLPITTSISLQKKTLDHKPHQKLKKKILKGHITSMHLSSNILFGTSSRLLKKKKHKRSKGIKNLSWEHFLDGDSTPTDLRPSTSEKFRTVPCGGSAHSRRKGVNSGSKKKEKSRWVKTVAANSNGDLSSVDKEFRERTDQNGSVLAADNLPQKRFTTTSERNQLDARESYSSEDSRRRSMQNGLMSMLTRGLEDTIVPRWDERESYPSRVTESSDVESVSIGYVADEWDEEYDRGKRKKVRSSKNTFGGQNPFQEIASTKAKLKKAKMAHSSSGNQPFRI